ncbi:MAG TPA: LCP family protein [Actinomycetota bacterium]
MRRGAALLVALVVGLGAWVAVAAFLSEPRPAGAQTPAVEISRAQDARYTPSLGGNRPIFILAIGSDARPDEQVDRRLADSLHIVAVNPRQGSASILGFPRDSYVPIPGFGEAKINESLYNGGPELVVETVEGLTGIQMDYWVLTSFRGLIGLVNGIGGLEIDVPYPMDDFYSGAQFEAGEQVIDGSQALAFARNRHDTPEGDFSRSENHGRLLLAALEQLRSQVRRDPTVLFQWIAVGLRNVQTDLSFDEVFDLMMTALSIDPESVTNAVVPGGTGSAGAASVVFLSGDAPAIFEDLGDDGILQNPPPPPGG